MSPDYLLNGTIQDKAKKKYSRQRTLITVRESRKTKRPKKITR